MMELLQGESLGARLVRLGILPARPALAIARQTASALAAAHGKGIVHRDLKPENLFLVPSATAAGPEAVKVLDFGIAKLRGDMSGTRVRTQTGMLMGTPPYMSPEQCRGLSAGIDHRTDIYALGIILFEMLCGDPPFVGEGFGDVLLMHMTRPAPPPRSRNPAVPPALERAILRALAKDPADRFDTMADLEHELAGIAGDLGADGEAVPAGWGHQVRTTPLAAGRAAVATEVPRDGATPGPGPTRSDPATQVPDRAPGGAAGRGGATPFVARRPPVRADGPGGRGAKDAADSHPGGVDIPGGPGAPEGQAPENQAPDSQAPDNQAPDNRAPDSRAPVHARPGVGGHSHRGPGARAPSGELEAVGELARRRETMRLARSTRPLVAAGLVTAILAVGGYLVVARGPGKNAPEPEAPAAELSRRDPHKVPPPAAAVTATQPPTTATAPGTRSPTPAEGATGNHHPAPQAAMGGQPPAAAPASAPIASPPDSEERGKSPATIPAASPQLTTAKLPGAGAADAGASPAPRVRRPPPRKDTPTRAGPEKW
jgi:eukaryotic-like serine/threonine-protein kinase